MIRGGAPDLRQAREPAVPDGRRDRRRLRRRRLRDGPRDGLAARVRLDEDADRPPGDQARHPPGVGRHDAPAADDRPRGRARRHPRGQGPRREAREEDRPRGRGRPAADPPRGRAKEFARGKFGTKKRSNAGPAAAPARVRERDARGEAPRGPGQGNRLLEGARGRPEGDEGPLPGAARGARRRREGLRRGRSRRRSSSRSKASGRSSARPSMRNLVGLFFRMEEVKKETGVEALGVGAVKPRKIARVGVLGAGVMGGGIAQLAADKGYPARMKDIKPEALALRVRAGREDLEGEAEEAPDDARRVRGEDVAPRRVARLRRLRERATSRSRPSSRRWPSSRRSSRSGRASSPRRRSSPRTPRRSRSPRSPRRRRTPSASSECTSSTRSTRCRSSR